MEVEREGVRDVVDQEMKVSSSRRDISPGHWARKGDIYRFHCGGSLPRYHSPHLGSPDGTAEEVRGYE